MFSYLKLKNFKSFKEIEIDFRASNKLPKNMIFIYGENGSGKTNLAYAFQFLKETIGTLNFQNKMSLFLENYKKDLMQNSRNSEKIKAIPFFFKDLNKLKEESRTIGSTDDMILEYGFNIDGIEGYYKLVFNDKLKEESLYYQINKNRGYIFNLNNNKKILSKHIFHNDEYKKELENLIEQFWGKHTFLSILDNEIESKNHEYLKNRIGLNLFKIMHFFASYSIKCKSGNRSETLVMGTKYKALMDLEKGRLPLSEEKLLSKKEELVRYFLTSIYSDIKDVYYIKDMNTENKEIKYKLYIKKLVGGKLRNIDFSLESTGTQNLLDLFLPLVECTCGNTSIIDEADTGIHDLLFNILIEDISDSIEGQLIVTTHNTTLLEKLNNENIYFILVDLNGNKNIVNVNDYKQRTQISNNIRDRYLKGMYGAIPNPGSFDFDNIIDILNEN